MDIFRSLLYDFSQIVIASEVLMSTFTKTWQKKQFYRKIWDECFCLL